MIIAYVTYALISWVLAKSGKKFSAFRRFGAFPAEKHCHRLAHHLCIIISHRRYGDHRQEPDDVQSGNAVYLYLFRTGTGGDLLLSVTEADPEVYCGCNIGDILLTWFGQTFLFLMGLLDVVLDIRKRFSQTTLNI
jgi:hypothetical protein